VITLYQGPDATVFASLISVTAFPDWLEPD